MKSVILIGFMGTGKSTIGKALSERMQLPMIDLDIRIEQEQQMQIGDIFDRYGEEAFRQMEHEALCRFVKQPNTIISPGGGAVLRAENRAVMREYGYVICLTARPEIILQRVNHQSVVRPVLDNRIPGQSKLERIEQLLDERMPCYREADLLVDTSDKTVDILVDEILMWLNQQAGEMV